MSFQPNPNRGGPPQDTLANLPSGTSFASKARAAELNAARVRQKAAEERMEEEQIPEEWPVSLADYQVFTRRGPRGKIRSSINSTPLAEEPQISSNSSSSSHSHNTQQQAQAQSHPPHQVEQGQSAQQSTVQQHLTPLQDLSATEQTGRERTSGVSAYNQYLSQWGNKPNRVLSPVLPPDLSYSPPPPSEHPCAVEQDSESEVYDTESQYIHVEMPRPFHSQLPMGTASSSHTSSRQSNMPTQQTRMHNEAAYNSNAMERDEKENFMATQGLGVPGQDNTYYR